MFERIWRLLIICVLATGFTILYNFDPASTRGIYPHSLVRELMGFYCPGCGTLRATHQLLHGNWQEALSLNCLIVVLLIYIIYRLTTYLIEIYSGINLPTIAFTAQQTRAIAVIVILYGILRNIPIFPFSWLAP